MQKIGEISLTPLLSSDLPKVFEIEQKCFSQPWSSESFSEVLASNTFGTLGARLRNNELIGYIIYSEVVDELHVLNVAVHPRYRQKGVATGMLAHLHRASMKRGRTFAYLEVRESNVGAQQLYAKFGYKRLTTRTDYYEDTHENAILMGVTLKRK